MAEPRVADPARPPAARRELRRAMSPRLGRLSAEVWFAEYPFRQDPAGVRRERDALVAYLAARGTGAEADDELENSPAVQLGPGADLDRAAALVAEWVESPD